LKPRWSVRIAGGICLLWCLVPVLLCPFPEPYRVNFIQEVEKREPAPWPQLQFGTSLFEKEIYQQLTEFLRDIFPHRVEAIILKNRFTRRLLGETRFNDVEIGAGGWMYLEDMYYRPYENETKTRRVLMMLRYAADHPPRGCDLRFVIPPDKDAILPQWMNARSRAFAERGRRRRDLIRNFCADRWDRKVIGLWAEYRDACARTQEPIFYRQDTHHTPFAAVAILSRTIIEAFHPGLWDVRDFRFLGAKPKVADLANLAGLGPWEDIQRNFDMLRPGVTLVKKDTESPFHGWKTSTHYISRSQTQVMIGGRTLLIHDSYLAENRALLSRYFSDVTYKHYDDVIAAGDPGKLFAGFDRVIVEVIERQSIFILDQLLTQLNSRLYAAIPFSALSNLNRSEAHLISEPEHLRIIATGSDPAIEIPALNLPPGHQYALRLCLDSNVNTGAQLFYREQAYQPYSIDRCLPKKVQIGPNSLWFEINDVQSRYPLRLDPGFVRGEYTLKSIQAYEILPSDTDAYEQARTTLRLGADSELPCLFQADRGGLVAMSLTEKLQANAESGLVRGGDGLLLQARNADPQLFLPGILSAPESRPRLVLTLSPPTRTQCQLFYREKPGQDFNERQSIRRNLGPGLAKLEIPLRPEWLANGLRFDPGRSAGVYHLHELSLRGVRLQETVSPVRHAPVAAEGEGTVWVVYPYSRQADVTAAWGRDDVDSQVQLTPSGGGFFLSTQGSNPAWNWPIFTHSPSPLALVRVYLDSAADSHCRLLPRESAGQTLSEWETQPRSLAKGRNLMTFAVSGSALASGLRLELDWQPRPYQIQGVEIYSPFKTTPLGHPGRYDYANLEKADLDTFFTFGATEPVWNLELTPSVCVSGNKETRVYGGGTMLRITAQGSDPFLFLPGLDIKTDAAFLARLQIAAPGPTTCQLFYHPGSGTGFQEAFSERRPLAAGMNVVYFYLEAEDLRGGLRLDPGEKPGDYTIFGWQVRRLADSEQ
jgi:hypothetical protein